MFMILKAKKSDKYKIAHIIANKIITDENGVTKHKLDLEIGKSKGQHNLSIDSHALLSVTDSFVPLYLSLFHLISTLLLHQILVSKAKAIGVDILPGVSPTAWTRCLFFSFFHAFPAVLCDNKLQTQVTTEASKFTSTTTESH